MRRVALLLAVLVACVEPVDSKGLDDERGDVAMGPLELSHNARGVLNLRDAEWMAWLSQQAYLEPEDFEAAVHQVAPDARISWFFAVSTQAYYVDLGHAAILVFRGSEAATADWRVNLDTKLVPAVAGNVHLGFDSALSTIWDFSPERFGGDSLGEPLRLFLGARHGARTSVVDGPDRVDPEPLYITGHSLGGALAMIAYVRAETDGCFHGEQIFTPSACILHRPDEPAGWWIPVHAVYTFGAPRIGDSAFGFAAGAPVGEDDRIIYRFVNGGDIVTDVPTSDHGYSHPIVTSELDFFVHIHGDEVTIGGIAGFDKPTIADHNIARYVRGLRNPHLILPN